MASHGSFDPASDLQVLVLVADPIARRSLKTIFSRFCYQVTMCEREKEGLLALQDNNTKFHLLLVDIDLDKHDTNNLQLFEKFKSKSDIPIIVMSKYVETEVVMKCLNQGASYFMVKPISEKDIKYIWQHAFVPRRTSTYPQDKLEQPQTKTMVKQPMLCKKNIVNVCYESKCKGKKPRIVWTGDLEEKFMEALDRLDGIATPPVKIHEYMRNSCARASGLTRENIASHLQKVRLHCEKINGGSWHGLKTHSSLPKFKQPYSSMEEMGYGFGTKSSQVSSIEVLLPMQGQMADDVNFRGGFSGFYGMASERQVNIGCESEKLALLDYHPLGDSKYNGFQGEASSFQNLLLNSVPHQNIMVPNEFGRVVVGENMVPLEWSSSRSPAEDVSMMKPQTNQKILMQIDGKEAPQQDSNNNWYL